MFNSIADWICNLMVWGSVFALAALLYERFLSPGFLAGEIGVVAVLSAIGIAGVLSLLWPKY